MCVWGVWVWVCSSPVLSLHSRCELSYLNIFPELDWKALTNVRPSLPPSLPPNVVWYLYKAPPPPPPPPQGTYHHAAQSQHLELAITLTIHYSIDLTLLAVRSMRALTELERCAQCDMTGT